MPSSIYHHISDIVGVLRTLHPSSFLDVACGFGRWGFLAREYCDIFEARYEKQHWQTRIDAVEIFENYICPHHRYIYDHIYITPIEKFVVDMPKYDVIYVGDLIEHLSKPIALNILSALAAHANQAMIVGVPLGSTWPQGEVLGNPFEAHVSVWSPNDLRSAGASYLKTYVIDDNHFYAAAIWTGHHLPPFPAARPPANHFRHRVRALLAQLRHATLRQLGMPFRKMDS